MCGDDMFDSTRFGNSIRRLRLQRGLSMEKLADSLHISETYLGKLERGERIPSIDIALTIINFFETSFNNYSLLNSDEYVIKQELYNNIEKVNKNENCKFLYDTLQQLKTMQKGSD